MRTMQSLHARANKRARGLIFQYFTKIKISWGSTEEIIKIRPTIADICLKTNSPV